MGWQLGVGRKTSHRIDTTCLIQMLAEFSAELNLCLIDSSASDNGFVQSRYQVLAQAALFVNANP